MENCAIVERGVITEKTEDGYKILSLDRDGLDVPPLAPVTTGDVFAVGQKVYYFVFNDGTGRIICGI